MFNLGLGELLVIAIIFIIVVGPERLPELMRSLGKALLSIQKANRDLQTSIGLDELRRELLYPQLGPDKLPKRQPLIEPVAEPGPSVTQASETGSPETAAPGSENADRQGGEHGSDGG